MICLIFTNLEVHALPLMICQVFRALTPFAVALLARLTLGEKINIITFIAMVVSFVGVVILSINQTESKESEELEYQPWTYTQGVMFALGAVTTCAVLCITTRSMQNVQFWLIIMSFNIACIVTFGAVIAARWMTTGTKAFDWK